MVDNEQLTDAFTLITLETVDSTNREALRRIAGGAPHFTVIRAHTQTDGRGRRGRSWDSPPGNLYATLIVRPARDAALGQLAFVAALGVGMALEAYAPVRFKWPNDLMLDGRKLGGILIEAEHGAAAIGIGVNLATAPSGTRIPATSVPGAPDPETVLAGICAGLDDWYRRWETAGFGPVREAWLTRAEGLGGPIEARLPQRTLTGTFAGLDDAGGLLLDQPGGGREVIAAGDIYFGTA